MEESYAAIVARAGASNDAFAKSSDSCSSIVSQISSFESGIFEFAVFDKQQWQHELVAIAGWLPYDIRKKCDFQRCPSNRIRYCRESGFRLVIKRIGCLERRRAP
jgi:hypothetical protein